MKNEKLYLDFAIKFKRKGKKAIKVNVGNVSKSTLDHFIGSIKKTSKLLEKNKKVDEKDIKKIFLRK